MKKHKAEQLTIHKKRVVEDQATLEDINQQLAVVTNLLAKILKDMQQMQMSKDVKLSAKARKSIERGLKDLESGRYTLYKDFDAFEKAYS